MSFDARLRQVRQGSDDSDTIDDLARDALAAGEEERAIPLVLAAAQKRAEPLLWQWTGLLNRALDEHATALECFAVAARLAPGDGKIAFGHAQVALEAGLDATALYEQARVLAPGDPQVLMGLTAARMAAGQSPLAVSELEAILDKAPLWTEGHLQLAQLRSLLGEPAAVSASLDRALAKHPGEVSLWRALCDLHLRREAYEQLLDTLDRADAAVPGASFDFYQAVALGELGDQRSDKLLSADVVAANPGLAVWRLRHLLRQGRVAEALPLIDGELGSERGQATWPYAAVAWRLTGDPRGSCSKISQTWYRSWISARRWRRSSGWRTG